MVKYLFRLKNGSALVGVIEGPSSFIHGFIVLGDISWVEYATLLDALSLRFTSKITVPGQVSLNQGMIADFYSLHSEKNDKQRHSKPPTFSNPSPLEDLFKGAGHGSRPSLD